MNSSAAYTRNCAKAVQLWRTCCRHLKKKTKKSLEEKQKERAMYYLLPTLGRTIQTQLNAKVDILKTSNTMESLENTDKLQFVLPGCKLIRTQEAMLFQQGCVGPKKLLTGLTRDREKKNRTTIIDLGLIVSSQLHQKHCLTELENSICWHSHRALLCLI